MNTTVQEWVQRKARKTLDPLELLQLNTNADIEYSLPTEKSKLSSYTVRFNGVLVAKSSRCVLAGRNIYIPITDFKYSRILQHANSNKRWRWARGEQVWYDVTVKNTVVLDAAYCYPEPLTHTSVKNCVTFLSGKGFEFKKV